MTVAKLSSNGPMNVASDRQLEMRLMAHALEGDGARRGDLLSYLYSIRKSSRASIELGQRDANALFDGCAEHRSALADQLDSGDP